MIRLSTKRPGFHEGVGVAIVVSVLGAVLFFTLNALLPSVYALYLLIPVLALAYLLYLLKRSPQRSGRVTVVILWLGSAALLLLLAPPLTLYLAAHIGLIWLVRSLYFHSGPLASLADMGLNAVAVAAASWALIQSGSILLTLWCFFLVQALFTAIPERISGKKRPANDETDQRFKQAQQVAEAAVRQLSNRPAT